MIAQVGETMNEISTVIQQSRRLEHLLKVHYHAEGPGLHQHISSCQERLPRELIPKLRYIATMRNKVVHEEGFRLDNKKKFRQLCLECEKILTPRSHRTIWCLVIFLIFAVTLGSIWFYYQYWQHLLPH